MKILVAVVLCFLSVSGFARKYPDIKITIGDSTTTPLQSKAFLVGYFINTSSVADSFNGGNTVVFKLKDTYKGLYNIALYTDLTDVNGKYQRMSLDVIITGNEEKDIEFKIDVTESRTLGKVTASSGENKIYNDHYVKHQTLQQKLGALETALQQYPRDDAFYGQLERQLEQVKKERADFTQAPCNDQSVSCTYLNAVKAAEKKLFSGINFSDPWLQNSPFISGIVWNYLAVVEADSLLTPGEKTVKTILCLDTILAVLKKDNEVYKRMLGEIAGYYERAGNNDVALYLNEKYLLKEAGAGAADKVKERIGSLESIQPGKPAPDIELSVMGIKRRLYDVEAEHLLLLFWDTDCPHCQETMRELLDFYHRNTGSGFEVVAVALDESEAKWLNYISEHGVDWLNFLEPEGWKGKAVKDYSVHSTPAMFLLDKNKAIVAKIASVDELKGKAF